MQRCHIVQFKTANCASDENFAKNILVLKFIIESRTDELVRHYSHSLYNNHNIQIHSINKRNFRAMVHVHIAGQMNSTVGFRMVGLF